jgi:peptidoglycan L-alanyl-D-glutamate endopeptidase CwlK
MRFFVLNTTPKKFVLSKLSLGRLNGVDANLVKVVKRAIEITPQDFMVVEGAFKRAMLYQLWQRSHSCTMYSERCAC